MNFGESSNSRYSPEWWSKLLTLEDLDGANWGMRRMIGMAAAFAPNPDRPPFYVDFQYELVNGKVEPVSKVWRKWLAHDPVALVPSRGANLRQLRGLRFDCRLSDTRCLRNSRVFAKGLSEARIPHKYEEYEGDHGNRIQERLETRVLPFFSNILEFSL